MTAPTTAEVMRALETARSGSGIGSDRERVAAAGEAAGIYGYALPIAEERDALAAEVARLREALAASEARATKAAEACEALEDLVDESRKDTDDSTRWEGGRTGARWQAWRNWAYDAIKAAKGARR